ncbi:uncharacterized protein LOC124844973 [Vigna umbellata]|uniref:uncharacterized protein LOC124844973 n=1 Tax=Vigna umbellata TaxID=87088 RepID=UPI001F5F53A5|nr:uncharacterized protein LOC124844973 [Vigna umbellata]
MKKRPSKKDKLWLDDYLHLLHSRQTLHLTINQLNQVIRIHGFKKIHHAPKKVLVEAVESLDLVDVPRSTLRDNVSTFGGGTGGRVGGFGRAQMARVLRNLRRENQFLRRQERVVCFF